MSIKKTIVSALVTMGVMAGASAHAAPEWYPADAKVPFEDVVIGFSSLGSALNGYSAHYHRSFDKYVEEIGVNVIMTDAAVDPARQADQVRDLIAQQVHSMIIWPVNGKAIVPAARQVNRANIPLVISNSMIDDSGLDYMTAYTGPDDYEEAQIAGRIMAEALDGSGNVVMLNGTPGYRMARLRIDGFMDAIKDFPDITVIDSQPANMSQAEGQSIMESYISRFGNEIDGVYSVDSGVGFGALTAAREAAEQDRFNLEDVKFVDATMYGMVWDLIKTGEYYGSVYQSPEADAKLAIKTAVLLAAGQGVEQFNYLETPGVTMTNVEEINRPNF